jgi:hypothetical protein
MTTKDMLTLGEFVRSAFAMSSREPGMADVKLIAYALDDVFTLVNAKEPPASLGEIADVSEGNGGLTDFTQALMRISGSKEEAIIFRRFSLPRGDQSELAASQKKERSEQLLRDTLEEFVAKTATIHITDVRLQELLCDSLATKFLPQSVDGKIICVSQMPECSHERAAIMKCMRHSQARWWSRAPAQRRWVVEKVIDLLRTGPVAHSTIADAPEWEEVYRHVGIIYSWFLYYFIGLIFDGHAKAQFTLDLAEVLKHFHKHPLLGVHGEDTNEWSILVR